MTFFSQRIPRGLNLKVAAAVRHTCWDDIFDGEAYHPNGKIISMTPMTEHSQEVNDYLNMFLRQEDYDRIEKWDALGIDTWNNELYQKEAV